MKTLTLLLAALGFCTGVAADDPTYYGIAADADGTAVLQVTWLDDEPAAGEAVEIFAAPTIHEGWELVRTCTVPDAGVLAIFQLPLDPEFGKFGFARVMVLADDDNDGLSNGHEYYITHTDPGNPDTDGDGLSDGDEVGCVMKNAYTMIPALEDQSYDSQVILRTGAETIDSGSHAIDLPFPMQFCGVRTRRMIAAVDGIFAFPKYGCEDVSFNPGGGNCELSAKNFGSQFAAVLAAYWDDLVIPRQDWLGSTTKYAEYASMWCGAYNSVDESKGRVFLP